MVIILAMVMRFSSTKFHWVTFFRIVNKTEQQTFSTVSKKLLATVYVIPDGNSFTT